MNFLSYLINGISLGSVYAIIALGYTMVYGIAKMLNFAHGDVIMIGCYVVFLAMSGQGISPLPAVVLSIIVCTVLGIVVEKIAYKPLRRATPLAVLITAIGVSYFLQNAALLLFGADTKSFSSVVSLPSLKLADGALTISGTTIVTVLACVVIMIALMMFIKKTKAGQAMLAVSEDKDGIVDDYIIYMLNALRQNASEIVAVVNGTLENKSKDKLLSITNNVIERENKGFDVPDSIVR